jgi:hypothetical protein
MEIQQALTLGRAQGDRVNPENGEVLAGEIVGQYPPVVSALPRGAGTWKILQERESTCRTRARSGTESRSRAEDVQVCEELRSGIDLHKIVR